MTIEEWIQGKVGFTLTDFNIQAILVDRSVTAGTDASLVEVRDRELCWADALTLYITLENKRIQDGGSSESIGAAYDRDEARQLALYLYGKWDEDVPTQLNLAITGKKTYYW